MKSFLKNYIFVLPAMMAIAWILPQSLFYDCVRPTVREQSEGDFMQRHSEEEYRKLFDVSEDEFEIVFGLREIVEIFRRK